MSLESSQRKQDAIDSMIGNASASNDPAQIPNDATDSLLKSAAAFAAGNTLGLSEEEVLAAISRQARADMRQYQPVGYRGSGMTREEVVNDMIRRSKQREAQVGGIIPELEDVSIANLQKIGSGPNRYFVDTDNQAYGEDDLTALKNPVARGSQANINRGNSLLGTSDQFRQAQIAPERTQALKARIEQELDAGRSPKEIRAMQGYGDEVEYLLDQVMAEKYPSYRAKPTRKQALDREIQKRKAERRRSGRRVFENEPVSLTRDYGAETTEFGSRPRLGLEEDPMTGEMVYAIDRTREPSGVRRPDRDAEAAAELQRMRQASADLRASEDARMRNRSAEVFNTFKAEVRARLVDAVLAGMRKENEIERGITPTRYIGDMVVEDAPNLAVAPASAYPRSADGGYGYVDPNTGDTVNVLDYAISGANTPDSGQMLNAPQGATEFVTKQVFEGGRYSRDQGMPAVDIGAELAGLDDAVARLGQSASFQGLQMQSDGIRTLDALQKTADAINAMAVEKGIGMYRFDEAGKRKKIDLTKPRTPLQEMQDAMTTLKLNQAQQERIAIALAQRGAASRENPISITEYLNNLAEGDTKQVINLERPARSALASGGKALEGGGTQGATIVEASVPIKRMPEGGKTSFRKDLQKAGQRKTSAMSSDAPFQGAVFSERRSEVVNPAGRISEDAAAPFMGVVSEPDPEKPGKEKAAPGTTKVSPFEIENIGQIAPMERVRRLEQKLGRGAYAATAAAMGEGASQSDVIRAMQTQYAEKSKTPFDERSLSKTVGRKESLASREAENRAMKRLLEGDLSLLESTGPGSRYYDSGITSFRPDSPGAGYSGLPVNPGGYLEYRKREGRDTPEAPSPIAAEVRRREGGDTPEAPVATERRRRRLGVIPTAAAVAGGGVLASLGLNLGGED